ncbi:MAG: TonB-dependent receptor [Bacteroidota bacterium]
MKRYAITFLIACSFISLAFAQRKVEGQVSDGNSSEPLIGATVSIKGTTRGSVTDLNGRYTIDVQKNDEILVFSYTGYGIQEIVAGTQTTLNVALAPNIQLIDEVVVVGYGKQIKSTLTGNIAKVGGESLKSMPVVSFEQALQGQAAGVYVESANGKLGGAMRMRIRGVGSLTAGAEPLIVVDGIPLSKDARNTSGAPLNPLADLNFNDIESIEVLKDASAKAIYGSRGSNGVLLITTKSGKNGRPRIEVDIQSGISNPTHKREFLNSKEYVELFTEAANNSDVIEGYDFNDPDSWTQFVYSRFERYAGHTNYKELIDRTNWQDEALRTGSQNNANVSFTGGSDKIRYYASANYGKTEGIVISNNLKKYGGRLNLDFEATKRLRVGVNLNLARTSTNQVSDDNQFSTPLQLVAMSPLTPTRDPDGVLYDRPTTTYYNGLIDVEDGKRTVNTLRSIANVYGDYRIAEGFGLRVEGASNIYTVNDDAYFGNRTDNGSASRGYGFSAWSQSNDYNLNAVLHFDRSLHEKHNVGFDLGTEFFKSQVQRTFVDGEQFPSDDFKTLASAASIKSGTSTLTGYSFLSYFGRARYDFKRKYLFNASARVDGSSRFGANNRYAFFPAASAGWVLSEEGFLKGNKTLSFLKLRGSWGQSGNAEIGDFQSLGLFNAGGYGGNSTLGPQQIPNPGLTWEKSTEVDFGIDFGLFNNRLSGELDYYVKNTTDLLLSVPIPSTTGFTNQTQNVGEMQNKGFEVVLNSNNLVGKFKWSTSVNLAANRNKIVALSKGQKIIDDGGSRYMNVVKVGSPIGEFYGPQYAGVDPKTGDALWYVNKMDDAGNIINPGATTSEYSDASFVELGSPLPKLIGGIDNTFSFAGISLDIRFQGQYGNKIHNSAGEFMSCSACWFDNQTRDQLKRWQKPGDITDVPQARLGYTNGSQSRSSRFLTDGSYLRLKNLSLAYDFPTRLLHKTGIRDLRIYLTGTNMLTFTKYKGWDPEVTTDYLASNVVYGVDFYAAPQPKTFVVGIRAGF